MSEEQIREVTARLEQATAHVVNLVNTSTVDMDDVHSTDQIKAITEAEKWLKENL